MATNRSSLSWLILVLALLIPGFLFYNWWSRMDRARKHDLNVKVRTRLGDTPFAGGGAPKTKLTNPMAAADPAAVAPGGLSPAAPASAAVTPLPGAAATSAPAQTAAQASEPQQPSAAPAPEQPPAAPVEPPLDAAPAVVVPQRDPTLSPYDVVRIERKLLEEQIRLREIEEAANKKVRKKLPPKDPDPRTLVDLQGIVETMDGNKAIVNGEMVTEGDLVGKVKVLKITSQGVVFGFKNQRFTKSVNK
ncbi:MAG: hypothetical protein AAB320_08690 [Elusimicrobiota bacterium]